MEYKQKLLPVQAIQVNNNLEKLDEFVGTRLAFTGYTNGELTTVTVPSLYGDIIAKNGDYIVKNVQGDYLVYSSELFTKMYRKKNWWDKLMEVMGF